MELPSPFFKGVCKNWNEITKLRRIRIFMILESSFFLFFFIRWVCAPSPTFKNDAACLKLDGIWWIYLQGFIIDVMNIPHACTPSTLTTKKSFVTRMGFYHRCTGITQRCVTTTATARAWRYTTPQSCVQIQLSCWWWDNGTSKYPPGEKGTRNLLSAAKRTPIDFWRDPLRSSVLSTICTILVRIPFVQDQFSPLHSALYFDQICVHILDL